MDVGESFRVGATVLHCDDALDMYSSWPAPDMIHVDGPYGVSGYPGDPATPSTLAEWYTPHVRAWSDAAAPATTLWFWGTEISWAVVHPVIEANGWDYEGLHVWDKGIAHVAGNVNSKTIRGFPVVTEVCARYSRRATVNGMSLKEWLRAEWKRSGLPLSRANAACGVRDAATRKYLAQDGAWYFPPADMMLSLAAYATAHGKPTTRPYFSLDGATPLTSNQWERMRPPWNHRHGTTNVWRVPAVRGKERVKTGRRAVHTNQKPKELIEMIVSASTNQGGVIWDPFAGLATVGVVANDTGRECHAAEITPSTATAAVTRLQAELQAGHDSGDATPAVH